MNIKYILTIVLLIITAPAIWATTWSTAYPYTQKIDGQKVTVQAFPYAPYTSSPMIGVTKVFFKNKLLYTMDKYYREKIFTSNDGQYLVVVKPSSRLDESRSISGEVARVDFNQTVIDVFKNGMPFKTFSLKDVIDTNRLKNSDHSFNWLYHTNFKAFEDAEKGCELCKEIYGKKILRTGDTTQIYADEWEQCLRDCDYVKLKEHEVKLADNVIYVQNNTLYILTNHDVIVKLDFAKLTIEQIPFEKIISNIKSFHPPKINRKYERVEFPEKFQQPTLKDGRSFEKSIAEFLKLTLSTNRYDAKYCIFIDRLVVNQFGDCLLSEGRLYDLRIAEFSSTENLNQEMTELLNKWVHNQSFDKSLIPKGFDQYQFTCIIYLE